MKVENYFSSQRNIAKVSQRLKAEFKYLIDFATKWLFFDKIRDIIDNFIMIYF